MIDDIITVVVIEIALEWEEELLLPCIRAKIRKTWILVQFKEEMQKWNKR